MLTKITETEKHFAEWLKEYHSGSGKSIKAKELRHWGSGREIRFMVHNLRMYGYPICSGQSGYYYASKSNDMVSTLNFLRSIIRETTLSYHGLNESYYEMKFNELEGEGERWEVPKEKQ